MATELQTLIDRSSAATCYPLWVVRFSLLLQTLIDRSSAATGVPNRLGTVFTSSQWLMDRSSAVTGYTEPCCHWKQGGVNG
jgi:hypothetical protein